jgi:polysaccharide transporter, PST family
MTQPILLKLKDAVKGNKRLVENIFSLSVLQGANYLLPLITVPYLVRVLGPERYGLLGFAQAFAQYFVILTDYGFNMSATRQIALNQNDPRAISEIFSSVTLIKFSLMLVSFLLMVGIVSFLPDFQQYGPVYYLSFLLVLGNVLFPVWFFQGMESMKYITILNLSAKSLSTLAIFALVHSREDYPMAAGVQASGSVVAGLLSMGVLAKFFPLRLIWPSYKSLLEVLKDGWYIFMSSASISLYTTSSVFILGLVTNHQTVGYYNAANTLTRAVQGLLSPVFQSIYPHMNALAKQSREAALGFIRKSLWSLGVVSLLFSVALFCLAEPLVRIGLGDKFLASIPLVRLMASLPLLIALGNLFGQTMLTFSLNKPFSRILLFSGLFNLALIVPMTHWLGAEGTVISVLLTEILVTGSMGFLLKRRGYRLFQFQS